MRSIKGNFGRERNTLQIPSSPTLPPLSVDHLSARERRTVKETVHRLRANHELEGKTLLSDSSKQKHTAVKITPKHGSQHEVESQKFLKDALPESQLQCNLSTLLATSVPSPGPLCPYSANPSGTWTSQRYEINSIIDCPGLFREHRSVPVSAGCSVIFARVMKDMTAMLAEERVLETENTSARHAEATAGQHQAEQDTVYTNHNGCSDSQDGNEDVLCALNTKRQVALRGWQIIRRNLQEVTTERKKKHSTFNWSFLRHHINHMSNQEKARQELYDKYIIKSHAWSDGLKNFPVHVVEKNQEEKLHKSRLQERGRSRAVTSSDEG